MSSKLPRSRFVSPLNDPSFVARVGIEIHARRRRRRHKGAQNLHRSQRQRGTAAATIRERRITIQLSAAAAVARRRTQKSRTVSSFAISSGAGGDRRPRCGFPRNGTTLRERGKVHAELVTASAHAHDLEPLSCRGWRDRMSRRKRARQAVRSILPILSLVNMKYSESKPSQYMPQCRVG